jgi:AraC-like DNA-binding protein
LEGVQSRDPFGEVAKAVEFVGQHLHRKINASEMAQAAGLSERSLNRKFHEAFNMAPHEFVSRTRIQAASKELIHSDKTIIDIATDCGFCDQSAFTVQFRKRTGMTPRKFRSRYRNDTQ